MSRVRYGKDLQVTVEMSVRVFCCWVSHPGYEFNLKTGMAHRDQYLEVAFHQ